MEKDFGGIFSVNINEVIALELGVKVSQVDAAVGLLDEGNTVPFISRYRKEVTGSLNDEQLRTLQERLTYLRGLNERKDAVIASIEEQGKLTEELKAQILAADTLARVEDLYLPYRPKRRTRASIAREKGLERLADILKDERLTRSALEEAAAFVSEENDVRTPEDALQGAKDILAEEISDNAAFREQIRELTKKEGLISSAAKDPETKSVYESYYSYEEALKSIPGHRVLALNRGENEKILSVSITAPEEKILALLIRQVIRRGNPYSDEILTAVVDDSYHRLIAPAIERQIRSELTENAQSGAIDVFGRNLKQLLLQPPLAGQVILGWDPAFRTGCKLAVVDETGKVLDTAVIYPTAPTSEQKQAAARKVLHDFIKRYHITVFSVGNGTASRESEAFIVDFLKEIPEKVSYVITNEAGASVYSASELATKEFPQFDVGQRSAASIARRLLDPLAELVKIDPKSIGVGQYQHDLNQKKLSEALGGVVEDCVNGVGVDLNTASAPLLEHISGITKTTAVNIVSYREENGAFTDRRELKKVPKLGPKAFQQCAGFMRIRGGRNPLDSTSVHPESYEAADALIKKLGFTASQIGTEQMKGIGTKITDPEALAEELSIGLPTLEDIVKELQRPGRDPREDMPKPILRSDVLDMKDLKEGMILKGTVRNIIDFGAFVDIGVHQDGLVHISEMSDKKFVSHPLDVVSIGDIVEVKVLGVDLDKQRISLTMRKTSGPVPKPKKESNAAENKTKGRKSGNNARLGAKSSNRSHSDRKSSGRRDGTLDLSALAKFSRRR